MTNYCTSEIKKSSLQGGMIACPDLSGKQSDLQGLRGVCSYLLSLSFLLNVSVIVIYFHCIITTNIYCYLNCSIVFVTM